MDPRRLEVEAWRDAILAAAGKLDTAMGDPSLDLESADNVRRSVYAKISRSRLHPLFRLYDCADATQHSSGHETTTTPVQQLFVLNSKFLQSQAEALAKSSTDQPDRVRYLYHRVFGRDPRRKELDLATSFLALLGTNEFIFLQEARRICEL